MLKSINIYVILNYTFVKDGQEYRFDRFTNEFLIFAPKSSSNLGWQNEIRVEFREFLHSQVWKIKKKDALESVDDFLKNRLHKVINQLKRRNRKESIESLIEKVLGEDKRFILHPEGTALSRSKEADELLQSLKHDLSYLESLNVPPPSGIPVAKIDPQKPCNDLLQVKHTFEELQTDNQEFSEYLEQAYQKNAFNIRENTDGDILPFLKAAIRIFLWDHLSNLIQAENTIDRFPDVDIIVLSRNISVVTTEKELIKLSQSRQAGLYRKDATQFSCLVIEQDREYIFCKIAIPITYFPERGFLSSPKQKSYSYYLRLLGNIRFGLQEFLNKHPVPNIPTGREEVKALLSTKRNNLNAYRETLEAIGTSQDFIHISIPVLPFYLIDHDWRSTRDLVKETIGYYNDVIENRSLTDRIIRDFQSFTQRISNRVMQFTGADLDELIESLRELAETTISQNGQKGEKLITTIFEILKAFSRLYSSVISAFDQFNLIRNLNSVSITDPDFLKIAFDLFKSTSWKNGYGSLTDSIASEVKKFGLVLMHREISSADQLSGISQQRDILSKLGIHFTDSEFDPVIRNIIQFARFNKSDSDCIAQCHYTIEKLITSPEKGMCYEQLMAIQYQPSCFDNVEHILTFLEVYLDESWEDESNLSIQMKDKIRSIFVTAIVSLLPKPAGEAGVNENLKILSDLKVELQEADKRRILHESWHLIYTIEGDLVNQVVLNLSRLQIRINYTNLYYQLEQDYSNLARKHGQSLIEFTISILEDCIARANKKSFRANKSQILKEIGSLSIITDSWEILFIENDAKRAHYLKLLKLLYNRPSVVTGEDLLKRITEILSKYKVKVSQDIFLSRIQEAKRELAILHRKHIIEFIISLLDQLVVPSDKEILNKNRLTLEDCLKNLPKTIENWKISLLKNEKNIERNLKILSLVYNESKAKLYQKFEKIRLSRSIFLEEMFILASFSMFSSENWINNPIPYEVEHDIKEVIFSSFNDPVLSNEEVQENLSILRDEINFSISEWEREWIEKIWSYNMKKMIDRRMVID